MAKAKKFEIISKLFGAREVVREIKDKYVDTASVGIGSGAVAGTLRGEELVSIYGLMKQISDQATKLTDALKTSIELSAEKTLDLFAQGETTHTVKSSFGDLKLTKIAPLIEKSLTEDTIAYLESKGVLEKCVDISATMKSEQDFNAIPEADLEVVKRYFNLESVPSMEKISAQIESGVLSQAALDDTMEDTVKRRGHTRITVSLNEVELAKNHLSS